MSTPARLLEAMPIAALIGIEISEAHPGLVRRQFDYVPERCTAGGVMHGGALMRSPTPAAPSVRSSTFPRAHPERND